MKDPEMILVPSWVYVSPDGSAAQITFLFDFNPTIFGSDPVPITLLLKGWNPFEEGVVSAVVTFGGDDDAA